MFIHYFITYIYVKNIFIFFIKNILNINILFSITSFLFEAIFLPVSLLKSSFILIAFHLLSNINLSFLNINMYYYEYLKIY